MIQRILVLTLFVAALAFGQATGGGPSGPNSVSVNVSRGGNLSPDQLVYSVTVNSGLSVGLADVQTAMQGVGLTQVTLTGLSLNQSGQPPQPTLSWTFSLPVALANSRSAVASLTAAQAAIGKNNSGLTLSFGPQGTQESPQLQQSQSCAAADLLSDARTKAQTMAAAAGQALGPILDIVAASVATDPGSGVLPTPTYLPVCSLTARFALGSGAVDGDAITINASRLVNLQPDQVSINVSLTTGATSTLDDAVAALPGSGITAANLSSVYTNYQSVPPGVTPSITQWVFTLAVPIAKLNDTLAALAPLQQATPAKQPAVYVSVNGLQVSAAPQASQTCPTAALVGDAQVAARKLALAAGVSVGPILAVGDGSAFVPTAAERNGDFSLISDPVTGVSGLSAFLLSSPAPIVPACAVVVQFKMLR